MFFGKFLANSYFSVSVETNIRIYSNIRIFSSEYWYSYSIRGHFQNPNIIRIFEYFGLNIQKLFDGKILEFLRNRDKIWTIFCKQVVNSKLLLMRANMCKILFNKSMFSGFVKNLGFRKIYNCANLFEYIRIFEYFKVFEYFLDNQIIFDSFNFHQTNNIQYSIRPKIIIRFNTVTLIASNAYFSDN